MCRDKNNTDLLIITPDKYQHIYYGVIYMYSLDTVEDKMGTP